MTAPKAILLAVLLHLFLVNCVLSLTCHECDSSAGDTSCLQNVVKRSWRATVCTNKIPELDFEIRPSAVRCVHLSYIEGEKNQQHNYLVNSPYPTIPKHPQITFDKWRESVDSRVSVNYLLA